MYIANCGGRKLQAHNMSVYTVYMYLLIGPEGKLLFQMEIQQEFKSVSLNYLFVLCYCGTAYCMCRQELPRKTKKNHLNIRCR